MFTMMVSMYILAFCRVVIGLVFMVSSISKALNIVQFRQAISTFRILPERLSGVAALLFLCGEFAVVVLVTIGGSLLSFGFALAIFLLLLFCIALVSVRMADIVVVLEQGLITEYGTHMELMNLGGTYAWLYNMQAEHYSDKESDYAK